MCGAHCVHTALCDTELRAVGLVLCCLSQTLEAGLTEAPFCVLSGFIPSLTDVQPMDRQLVSSPLSDGQAELSKWPFSLFLPTCLDLEVGARWPQSSWVCCQWPCGVGITLLRDTILT